LGGWVREVTPPPRPPLPPIMKIDTSASLSTGSTGFHIETSLYNMERKKRKIIITIVNGIKYCNNVNPKIYSQIIYFCSIKSLELHLDPKKSEEE